jgi:hypothetical protein
MSAPAGQWIELHLVETTNARILYGVKSHNEMLVYIYLLDCQLYTTSHATMYTQTHVQNSLTILVFCE